MKQLLTAGLLVILAACAEEPPVLTTIEVFRNPTAQIASQTDVTAERMVGDWFIRQRFASPDAPQSGMSLRTAPDGALVLALSGGRCIQDDCFIEETLVLFAPTGPGRWTPVSAPQGLIDAELWVMWMDFDSRTAAIGTPSGEFGWIMDKNPSGGGDRITAARDIMDWFGYNVARLEEVSR